MCVSFLFNRFVVTYRNAGARAAGVDYRHVVPAYPALDVFPVLLAQLIRIAAGDLPLAVHDEPDQNRVCDDQVRQQQVAFLPAAPPDVVRVSLLQGLDVPDVHPVGRMVVGDRHPLKGCDGRFGKNLFFRPADRNQAVPGQPELSRQILLYARACHRHVQA